MKKYRHKKTKVEVIEKDAFYQVPIEGKLPKWIVENSPAWEEVIEYSIGTKAEDTRINSVITKKVDGWYKEQKTGYTDKDVKYSKHIKVLEEVVEKEYEILSFKNKCGEIIKPLVIEDCLNNSFCNIHSIKRLSDGEVFTVGDRIKGKSGCVCIIKEIWLNPNCSNQILFNHLDEGIEYFNTIKLKQPLFTTEDGVDIFEGDKFYYPTNDFKISFEKTPIKSEHYKKSYDNLIKYCNNIGLKFSTKEAAEQYILINKPCLSINDVKDVMVYSIEIDKLKKLVKSKLK